jgi:Ni/Co efflux regulator RcnB
MKKHLLLAASLALLSLSTTAIAKGPGHGHGGGHGNHPPGKHKGWHKNHRKGDRLEVVYLEPRYHVDYRHHHLSAPPPGHRWVRHPDGRFILVAVATGIIADILLHH